jgi:uncharacterized radical SAM superfamily protein
MKSPSAENLWRMEDGELSTVLDKGLAYSRRKTIRFYAPSFMYYKTSYYCSSPNDFPTISVTGKGCALRCKHCGGIVLNTMYPAVTPEALYKLCFELKAKGASGCLISGGCLPNGAVPVAGFIDAIARVKRELDFTIFVHTGIIDLSTAKALKEAGVDVALLDIIGSDDTIHDVYKLDVSARDYGCSLRALKEAGIAFVPHVIVGLHHGKLDGELNALKMISDCKPSALVIIAFMPIHGTEMENVKPPRPIDIARVVACARTMFRKTPLVLGCMRPRKDRSETEILAVKAGVDAVAFPTEDVVKFVEEQGQKISFSPLCCSQIYSDMKPSYF